MAKMGPERHLDTDIRVKIVPVRRGTRVVAIAEHWETGLQATSLPRETEQEARKEALEALAKAVQKKGKAADLANEVEHHTR